MRHGLNHSETFKVPSRTPDVPSSAPRVDMICQNRSNEYCSKGRDVLSPHVRVLL